MGALLKNMRRVVMTTTAAGGLFIPSGNAQDVRAAVTDSGATTDSIIVAEDSAPETPVLATPTPPPLDHLPAGTIIEIGIDEPVNSKTHKTGDWYAISLSKPVMLGEIILIPAGTPGRGQVVHSAKSGWGGKAGELILGARYLEFNGRQIPLRGMKLGGVGGNNEGLAFATSVAGGLVAMPLVFVINGKNADIPTGMLATAKLAVELYPEPAAVPPIYTAAPGPQAQPVSEPEAGPAPVAEPEETQSVPIKQEDI